ncbi:translation factor [Fistulina hepatica ATCC 64428]|uniref:Threonylcarbamoyl-AMP synthase n=1 Tax=Fistulina hepatica ATCC 64428 TaxID=1128425 RepID=A0A0D7AJY2_9AGAR|nr:translation factor [Fistulina hepatica ATCC 64428]
MSFATRVLKCDAAAISFPHGSGYPEVSSPGTLAALKSAAHDLVDLRQTVVFPTETVYGLGAMALDTSASDKIFSTKGRPPDNPLIVHVSSLSMLRTLLPHGYDLSESYRTLISRFWPGPLTLLFPRNVAVVPSNITAGQSTVAVRMPSHPVARALIAISDTPLAAPSANSSGKPSPTRAEHVLHDLNGKVALILDGGACGVGLESTVIDGLHEDGDLRVLRPGGVTVEAIERALAEASQGKHVPKVLVYRRDYRDQTLENAPTTPGMKYRHYSPSVPVILLLTSTPVPNEHQAVSFAELLSELEVNWHLPRTCKVGLMFQSDSALAGVPLSSDGFEWYKFPLGAVLKPAISAQRLFDGLLTLERQGVDLILVEEIRENDEGLAFMNRVKKAAGSHRWIRL